MDGEIDPCSWIGNPFNPFGFTVIQIYALTSNAKEAEVEQFYEDLKHLVELTAKICPLHYRGLE